VCGQDATKTQKDDASNHASPPSCKYCPSPEYPPEARNSKIDSVSVLLEVTVTEKGKAKDVKVLKDPGLPGFGFRAVDAVKEWKFNPAKDKDGKPVETRTKVEVVFRLLN
jgi:periplasmic protein TonB